MDDRRTLKYLQGYGQIRLTMCKGANYAAMAGDDVDEVLSHPILDVLQNPDPVYSGQVWMQAIWFQREVAGRHRVQGAHADSSKRLLLRAWAWYRLK